MPFFVDWTDGQIFRSGGSLEPVNKLCLVQHMYVMFINKHETNSKP